MPRLSISEIVKAVDGHLSPEHVPPGDVFASGYSFDTRTLAQGDLFFALSGGRRDGHDFVSDSRAGGAVGAVVEHEIDGVPDDFIQIVVNSPLEALSVFRFRYWRWRRPTRPSSSRWAAITPVKYADCVKSPDPIAAW